MNSQKSRISEIMVSIRMPKELADEIKSLAEKEHFMDLSERIRSIARQKWNEYTDPEIFEIKKLRENIEEGLKEKSLKKIQQEVAKDLNKIKSSLKREGFSNE